METQIKGERNSADPTSASNGGGERDPELPEYFALADYLVIRYPEAPSHSADEVQNLPFTKWMKMLDLPSCSIHTEASIEDWADRIAAIAKQLRPSLPILLRAMQARTDSTSAAVLEELTSSSFEDIISCLCLELFPRSDYAAELETALFQGKRHKTVLEAKRWIRETTAMSDSRMRRVILSSVPRVVENEFWMLYDEDLSLDAIFNHLTRIEAALLHRHGSLPVDHVPSLSLDATTEDTQMQRPKLPPRAPCRGCGKLGHWRNDCPHKAARCTNCDRIGHLTEACRSRVERDTQGRIRNITTTTPGHYQTVTKKDRTQ